MTTLDPARLKADFDRDGFAVLPQFLTATELEELSQRATACISGLPVGKAFPGTVKNLNRMDPWFEDQLLDGKQVALIEHLLSDSLEPATAAYFDRLPGESAGIAPHFDALGHRREGATIWIALDRAERENGCLYYIKGSHRTHLDNKLGLDFSVDSEGAVPVEIDPGDAVVHSSLTVHWSERNRSQRSRRAVSYFYWAASSRGDRDNLAKQEKG